MHSMTFALLQTKNALQGMGVDVFWASGVSHSNFWGMEKARPYGKTDFLSDAMLLILNIFYLCHQNLEEGLLQLIQPPLSGLFSCTFGLSLLLSTWPKIYDISANGLKFVF